MKAIILIFISIIYCKEKIKIYIEKQGKHNIIYKDFKSLPNSILFHNENISPSINSGQFYFSGTNNEVILEWSSAPADCTKMFYNCKNITSIDLTEFNINSVVNMSYMFYSCSSLTIIKFKNVKAFDVKDMSHMFHGCSSLNPSNLNKYFDTSQVTNMAYMFCNTKLSSFNFGEFNVNRVKNMGSMFSSCSSLNSITLYSSKLIVTNIESMFSYCNKLNSLDFNHFITSEVTNMRSLFSGCSKLTSVISLDTSKVENMENMFSNTKLSSFDFNIYNLISVTNMKNMFNGCSSLNSINLINSKQSNIIMEEMFSGCTKIISLDFTRFDTSLVKNMKGMFEGCTSLTSISNLNTSSATNMESMFENTGFSSFNLDIFDISNVNNMKYMFSKCKSLTTVNFGNSNSNSRQVTNIAYMFSGCSKLEKLNFKNFITSNVVDMSGLFSDCILLKSLDLSNFDTSKVVNIAELFSGCEKLESLDLSKFRTSKITDMSKMFSNCKTLKILKLSNFETSYVSNMAFMFNGCTNLSSLEISYFETSNVINMRNMFSDCSSLISINLTNFETSKVVNMYYMFYGCKSLKTLDLSNFEIQEVLNMSYMFYGCEKLELLDLSNFKTSKVENMYYMFYGCKSLKTLDLSNFITSNALDMSYMFYGCESLTSINISNFKVIKVKNMKCMFCDCKSLESLDISNFGKSNVTNISYMFYNCTSLKFLNISNFYSTYVEDISFMFYNCFSFISLNLSKFDTSNTKLMKNLFYNCFSLTSINLSNFNTINVLNMENMFYNCSSLVSLDLSNFSGNQVTNLNFMFSKCSSLIILNLSNFNTPLVTSMNYMFNGCTKLKYVNFSRANDNNLQINSYSNIFNDIPNGFIICIKPQANKLFSLIEQNNNWAINCSEDICTHYHYYNNLNEIYFTDTDQCPKEYKNLILEQKECVNNCTTNKIFQYEFRNRCYKSCPTDFYPNLITNTDNIYKCEILCQEETPFEIIENQECVKFCDIMEIYKKTCKLNYNGENSENIMLNNILQKIISINFYQAIKDENIYLELNEKQSSFIITETNNEKANNIIELGECGNILRNIYGISENNQLYIFIINAFKKDNHNNNKSAFELYYPIDDLQLSKLDLSVCENIIIKNILTNCSQYSIESIHEDSCLSCKKGYYPIYNEDSINNNLFKKCYKNPEGYYLSKEEYYKKCYSRCKICDSDGNNVIHNCLECKYKYNYEMILDEHTNCYEYCWNYTYDIYENKFICLEKPLCDNINDRYIPDIKKCINDCRNSSEYKYEFRKNCYKECPSGTKILVEDKYKTNDYLCQIECTKEFPYEHLGTQQCIQNCSLIDMFNKICRINYRNDSEQNEKLNKKIIQDILNGNLGPLLLEILEGNSSFIIEDENDAHFISTIKGQLSEMNFSSVDFGECERYLRNISGIKDTEELIMYKIEHYIEGYNIPIIEYVLFTQDGKIQLNLSLCEDMKIQYYIPVSINENELEKYDPDSDYYNEECKTYKSKDGLDMTSYERKEQFNKNNMSLCEKGCNFIKYHPDTQQAECDCNIKGDMDYSNDDIEQKVLLNQIDATKSKSNLKIAQCTNIITSPEKLISNSGFFLLLFILVIFIIVFILFCKKGKRMLEEKVDEIIYKKFQKHKTNKNKITQKDNKIFKHNKKSKIKRKKTKFKSAKHKQIIGKTIIGSKRNSKISLVTGRKSIFDFNKNRKTENKRNEVAKKIMQLNSKDDQEEKPDKNNDYELNISSYRMAVKYDKRSCCEYYISLVKNKQIFMFTFCSFNDYNSGIIKKFIFFLSFAVHYTVNALFFTEDTFHQIYEDGGSFNFMYQLPKILISAVISTVALRIILETLVLTDRNVLQVKHQKTYNEAKKMKINILKYINIKFGIFFVLNFILLILFWFYLTIFNGLYENSQIFLIENTVISFGISLFYPVFWNIIPSMLRICSLGNKKSNRQCIYKISKILQVI